MKVHNGDLVYYSNRKYGKSGGWDDCELIHIRDMPDLLDWDDPQRGQFVSKYIEDEGAYRNEGQFPKYSLERVLVRKYPQWSRHWYEYTQLAAWIRRRELYEAENTRKSRQEYENRVLFGWYQI